MRFYENILKTSENREKARSYYIPKGSAKYESLNGKWRFAYIENSDLFERVEKWDEIKVPSCWQLLGYEDPNYTNICFPFTCDMPYVPNINPMGVYEKDIVVDNIEDECYIVFEGVTGCAVLFVNGERVGYTQGSHFQAEFKIGKYLRKGQNTIRVCIYKWCVGSYIESQDMFRHNGIFRDVYLLFRRKNHIKDIDIKTENNEKIIVKTDKNATVSLYDKDAKLIDVKNGKECLFFVEEPYLWSAESPYLYTVKVEYKGEIIEQRVGLRTITVSYKNEILINGKPIKIKGVNHHDTSLNGFCMTREEMRRDIELMKELNMNAVRTAHYPPHPEFVSMCDEMGMYVILECDNEAHGFLRRYPKEEYEFDMAENEWPASNPQWKKEHLDRIERTYQRDKNHSSVIMWSMGNESGYSPVCIDPMIEYVRARDNQRLIHYESAEWTEEGRSKTDVYSTMYPPISRVLDEVITNKYNKPIFYCEYSHAAGNGPEDVWAYVELMHKYPNFTGGCIWEWSDHAVSVDGVLRYGGDFPGEKTHDGNLCCDGLVFADRSFKAGTREVKCAFAPYRFEYKNGTVAVHNLFDFTSLAEYELHYKIRVDDKIIEEKRLRLDIPPRKNGKFKTCTVPDQCYLGASIDLELVGKDGKSLGELTQIIKCKKIKLKKETTALRLINDVHYIYAFGDGFEYRFNKQLGNFDSVKVDDRELLTKPVRMTAFRALTDNDRKMSKVWTNEDNWFGENLNRQFTKVYDVKIEKNTIIATMSEAGITCSPFFRYVQRIKIFKDGRIAFSVDGKIREPFEYLPRLGYEFRLCKSLNSFNYFGMGPWENYLDLYHHTRQDWFESDTDKEYVNYPRPQEHGNHTRTLCVTVGNVLKFSSEREFEFNMSNYNAEQLHAARHTDEIGHSEEVNLRIDYKCSGIGAYYDESVRLKEKDIKFSFDIELV